jgi:hypothetical protein
MSILNQFTTTTEIPGFGTVSLRNLDDARRALCVGETKCQWSGPRTTVTGSFLNHQGFTLSECVEILEAVFGGTFGANAVVKNDGTFRVDSWAE